MIGIKAAHRNLVGSSRIALDRAENLIFDLIAAARAGELDMSVGIENLNLGSLVKDSCLMAQPVADESGIRLLHRVPSSAIIANGDPLLLSRIVDNLIYNAIRHTPSGEEILVEVVAEPEVAGVTITDGGSGFDRELNPTDLFTLYKQADYRARGLHRGVGIGLYFCRLAITEMGGTISAENSAEAGASFHFTVPYGGLDEE